MLNRSLRKSKFRSCLSSTECYCLTVCLIVTNERPDHPMEHEVGHDLLSKGRQDSLEVLPTCRTIVVEPNHLAVFLYSDHPYCENYRCLVHDRSVPVGRNNRHELSVAIATARRASGCHLQSPRRACAVPAGTSITTAPSQSYASYLARSDSRRLCHISRATRRPGRA